MTRDELETHRDNGVITHKEFQVLELRERGFSDRRIASTLRISRGAVRDRRKNALLKIVRNESEAA